MTMICVTHEMGFARNVANRVIFMDRGEIIEQNNAGRVLRQPAERTDEAVLEPDLHSIGWKTACSANTPKAWISVRLLGCFVYGRFSECALFERQSGMFRFRETEEFSRWLESLRDRPSARSNPAALIACNKGKFWRC